MKNELLRYADHIVIRNHRIADGETARLPNGQHSIVIAVNDDVGDGYPIDIRGMDIDTYMKHGAVLFAHESWNLPVGRTSRLYFDDRGRLVAEFAFSQQSARAQEIEGSWDEGHLRCASISATPIDRQVPHGRHRLVEWSLCAVPADTDAVRGRLAGYRDGLVRRGATIDDRIQAIEGVTELLQQVGNEELNSAFVRLLQCFEMVSVADEGEKKDLMDATDKVIAVLNDIKDGGDMTDGQRKAMDRLLGRLDGMVANVRSGRAPQGGGNENGHPGVDTGGQVTRVAAARSAGATRAMRGVDQRFADTGRRNPGL